MITFKQDIQLTVVEEFDEITDNIVDESHPVFKAGEYVDADIVSQEGNYVDLQFGDTGGVAFNVQRDSFEVL